MKRTPLSLVAHWAGGELAGDDVPVETVTQDTRKLPPGALYVALRGERFDGHDFAYDAAMRGAGALLVERALEIDLPQVRVDDTLVALGRIAAGVQRDRQARVVAITGSNGKTSVKTLVQSILQRAGQTYANPGNFNNEVGLPLAVIDAPEDAEFAIYEMGAGKPGDIAYLTGIVQPDVALVNNIAPAHLERMGTLTGVAETKGAILEALVADGVAVVNADDAFAEYFVQRAAGRRVIRFGLDSNADVMARSVVTMAEGSRFQLLTAQGELPVRLTLPGRHNVMNALAATAIALACDVPLAIIADGLEAARPVAGRQVAHTLARDVVLIDDSYNANPASLAAAIDTLAMGGGEAWLVLGDMRELGPEGEALHAEAGRRAKAAGISRLYALGALSTAAAQAFGDGGRVFTSHAELAKALRLDIAGAAGTVPARVLVKGSRGSAMDRIVGALLDKKGDALHVA